MDRVELRERIRALRGVERLLSALEGLSPAWLVGGAVRDLLRGAASVDLDLCVEGDARALARELADRLGGVAVEHERFGTAAVRAPGLVLDLAATRRERYERPGALPLVEPARLEEDLARRDFTVNAMAADLAGDRLGCLRDPHGGRADLASGVVRILHPRSFVDDPTRLLRAVRYEARLGGRMDSDTEARAREAVRAGALGTVSGPRTRDELLDLLAEPDAPRALERVADLDLDGALHPSLRVDPDLAAGAALGAMETGADRVLATLAALVSPDPLLLVLWLDRLGVPREARERVAQAARGAPEIATALRVPRPDSELHGLLHGEPPEALALAMALGAPPAPVLRFVGKLQHVRLEVTGADLLAAGVPQSPALGRALEGTLRRKLDGRVRGRDEELRTALELAAAAAR